MESNRDTSIGRNAQPIPSNGRSPLAADGRPILPGGTLWRWDTLLAVRNYYVGAHSVIVLDGRTETTHNADYLCIRRSDAMKLHAERVIRPEEDHEDPSMKQESDACRICGDTNCKKD